MFCWSWPSWCWGLQRRLASACYLAGCEPTSSVSSTFSQDFRIIEVFGSKGPHGPCCSLLDRTALYNLYTSFLSRCQAFFGLLPLPLLLPLQHLRCKAWNRQLLAAVDKAGAAGVSSGGPCHASFAVPTCLDTFDICWIKAIKVIQICPDGPAFLFQ